MSNPYEQKAREISSYIGDACGGLGYPSRYRELEQRIAAALSKAVEAETRECVRIVALARGFSDIGERDLRLIKLIEDALDARILRSTQTETS